MGNKMDSIQVAVYDGAGSVLVFLFEYKGSGYYDCWVITKGVFSVYTRRPCIVDQIKLGPHCVVSGRRITDLIDNENGFYLLDY